MSSALEHSLSSRALFTVAILCALLGGCFSSVRYDHLTLAAPPPLGLTVAVVPDPGRDPATTDQDLESLAELLRGTRLFDEVRIGQTEPADISAVVHPAIPGFSCGMPLLATIYSLGAVPTTLPILGSPYNFELTSEPGVPGVRFHRSRFGDQTYGAVALPMRWSKAWRRPSDRDATEPAIGALQFELLEKRREIFDLLSTAPSSSPSSSTAQ